MTHVQIDMSKTPLRSWTIAGSALMPPRAASFAVTPAIPVPTESPRASDGYIDPSASSTLDERLFDHRAALKIATSLLATHLSSKMRSTIFSQLDHVLDLENWQDDSALIQDSSFKTFLRFMVFASPTRLPSL